MAIPGYTLASIASFVGQELGVSSWLAVDQQRIEEFARATGDHQWIHVDVERARRESPYGQTIAHGFLTLSLVAGLTLEIGVIPPDVKAALNYGLDKVRFIASVKSGARVRNRVRLLEAEDKGKGRMLLKLQNTIEIEGEEKPALIAETLSMLLS